MYFRSKSIERFNPSIEVLIVIILVSLEILELKSTTTEPALASKNSPSKVTALYPVFDMLRASSLDFTKTTLPKSRVLSDENLPSHLMKSDIIPMILESLGGEIVNLGIASRGIIFNFGNFLERTKSARFRRVVKSLTTIALIISELTANAARSYSLSHDSIS